MERRVISRPKERVSQITIPGRSGVLMLPESEMPVYEPVLRTAQCWIIPTSIHPGGSIGPHKQESGDDMNYIISGNGKAFCDGTEEALKPGVMHICPKGSVHSIVNTGEEDLVMLTIVVKK